MLKIIAIGRNRRLDSGLFGGFICLFEILAVSRILGLFLVSSRSLRNRVRLVWRQEQGREQASYPLLLAYLEEQMKLLRGLKVVLSYLEQMELQP